MSKRVEELTVISNRMQGENYFVLVLSSDSGMPEILPGQFAQVQVPDSPATFLRRPLSIHDTDRAAGTLSLLVQIAGQGTEKLSLMQPGSKLNLVYPLGNSFTMPSAGEKVLLTGGGTGIAPLLLLGKHIRAVGAEPVYALGFRNRERIPDLEPFRLTGEVNIATEDGSEGYRGFVTGMPLFREGSWDRVYTCGPEPMMKAVAAACTVRNIFCEVSLENLMACGFGVCLCCIVPTTSGNLCTCTDGPVFNINDLKWQI